MTDERKVTGINNVSQGEFEERQKRVIKRHPVAQHPFLLSAARWMSDKEFSRLLRSRKTILDVDGQTIELRSFYEESRQSLGVECRVSYDAFFIRHKRLRKLNQVTLKNLNYALTLYCELWQRVFGKGFGNVRTYKNVDYPSLGLLLLELDKSDDYSLIRGRLKQGWSLDRTIETPKYASDKYFSVYRIDGPTHRDTYIGITGHSDVSSRFNEHVQASEKSNRPLAKAIRKYGVNAFSVELIEEGLSETEAKRRERELISSLHTKFPTGLNATGGGESSGGNGRPVEFGGRKFKSMTEAGKVLGAELGLQPYTIEMCLREGRSFPSKQRVVSKHPDAGTPFYRVWRSLFNGVKAGRRPGEICDAWLDYVSFKRDTIRSFKPGLKMIRRDKSGPWGPENFLWVTPTKCVEATHGTSISCFGKEYGSYTALAHEFDIPVSTLKYRIIKQGMLVENAVSKKIRGRK